ncbi:helix-turn-helix domain-containing protein [Nocardiopsis changdeensis]|uniref:Helix-turn-helix domain-containing protein n=1 Tax=Nocardiopsis changdeensis TaxID=2831969 RepID=A0ABX8BEB1_9ACTN|nr:MULTISPECIES: helix-turn-helix domain-containing protein [Nocardiopsis]QUX20582.1 helix-turn-helix domain-containing protein [Nocardiopsis changdeensis]QYX36513.1 helix-turn-helix domain-containing protein [Nocardiopsis sp. MT53]
MDQVDPREELSERLDTARLRLGLTKEQLRARAGLGRTTVSNALNGTGPLPTKETITALARALGLESGLLLELRRKAADPPGQIGVVAAPGSAPPDLPAPDPSTHAANTIIGDLSHSTVVQAHTAIISPPNPPAPAPRPAPGRPIGECDPHDLEMRVAGSPPDSLAATVSVPQRDTARLPGYVRRDHDDVLDRAVRAALGGSSRMVVLVGLSSTGKTRACWESVQPLAEHGWRLWHPFDPTRAEAALEGLGRVGPRTVVWLNESQHYLGHSRFGEQIAAALHVLLTNPDRGPVLVLGTLWEEHAEALTTQPKPGHQDAHAQARALLEGRQVTVPVAFTNDQLDNARELAQSGDGQLAHALEHVRDGRLAQTLAGAPELVRRYETASPGARAILNAAMDALRLGVSLHLPLGFLVQAAEDYLTDDELDALPDQWVDQALKETGTTVHGGQAPLRQVRTRRSDQNTSKAQGAVYRLEDYLEQHGAHERRMFCPPLSFWQAAHDHLIDPESLYHLGGAANIRHRLHWAARLFVAASEHGRIDALVNVAQIRHLIGDSPGAEELCRRAAKSGHIDALGHIVRMRAENQDYAGAEIAYREAVEAGHPEFLLQEAIRMEEEGDLVESKKIYHRLASSGDIQSMVRLGRLCEMAGDNAGAEESYRQAVAAGDKSSLSRVARMRELVGDFRGAERLTRQGVRAGDKWALVRLILMREESGRQDAAEILISQAIETGDIESIVELARVKHRAGDWEYAEKLQLMLDSAFEDFNCALGAGRERPEEKRVLREHEASEKIYSLVKLAALQEEAGNQAAAEHLARRAADAGNTNGLAELKRIREESDDEEEFLLVSRWESDLLWPHGLDPDGTPSQPW